MHENTARRKGARVICALGRIFPFRSGSNSAEEYRRVHASGQEKSWLPFDSRACAAQRFKRVQAGRETHRLPAEYASRIASCRSEARSYHCMRLG